jgi:transcriptional antiterminator
MANQRVINGKNTLARIKIEFQKLLDSGERVTVAEFSSRVGISPNTLAHHYRDWAVEVRKLRDEVRSKPRKRSPASLSYDQITELEQATQVITKLRMHIVELEIKLSAYIEEDNTNDKWEHLRKQLKEAKEENERLRGVIVSLQQEIVRYMSPELSRRIMKMIEKLAAKN